MVGAERLAASVAMELVAAGAKHLAASGVRTRPDFEECVAAVFVVLDRKALEERLAGGAGGGSKLLCHINIIRSATYKVNPGQTFSWCLLSNVILSAMKRKNQAAAALGRKGGKARAKNLTPEELSEQGRKAVMARWNKRKKKLDSA